MVKLTKLIPNIKRSVLVRPGYRYREQFNRMIIKMMSAGTLQRIINADKKFVDQADVYHSMSVYSVETEGVMFLHVKYFAFFLVASVGISFLIFAFEWIAKLIQDRLM